MQKRLLTTLFISSGLIAMTTDVVRAAQTLDHLHEYQGLDTAFGSEARTQRRTSWVVPSRAQTEWGAFLRTHGSQWRALWDTDSAVPLRIYGKGILAAGANGSAVKAEKLSREILATHLGLLAPGSSVSDFRLVTNEADRGIRSIGFIQLYKGKEVIGG